MSRTDRGIPPRIARLLGLADRDPRRTVGVAQRLVCRAGDTGPARRAWCCYAHGYALLRWERLSEAEQALRQAQLQFVALDMPHAALHARCGALMACLLLGHGAELQDDWERLAADYTAAGLALDAARAAMYQCWHRNRLGRPRAALELAQTIRPLIEQEAGLADRGRLLRIMAASHDDCGELEQALVLIDQALALFAPARLPVETARCLVERAWYLQRKETFEPAIADLQRAHTIFSRYQMTLRLAICDQHLGLLVSRLGRYDEALTRTLCARAAFLALGQADSVALTDMNLGTVAYYSGLFDLALAAYQRAEVLYRQLGFDGAALVSRRNQALVLSADGRPDTALRLLRTLLPLAKAAGNQVEIAEIYYALGQTLCSTGCHDEALADLHAADALFLQVGNAAASAKCRLEQGWVYLAQREYDAARVCLSDSRALLAERPFHHWRADYGLACCAERRGQDEQALLHYQHACTTVSRLRQRLVSEHASSGIFAQARQMYLDALRLALRCRRADVILNLAEQQRALVLARQLSGWHAGQPAVAGAADPRPFDLETVLSVRAEPERLEALITSAVEHALNTRHHRGASDDQLALEVSLDQLRQQWSAAYPQGWTALVFVPCEDLLIGVVCDPAGAEIVEVPLDQSLRHALAQVSLRAYRPYIYQDVAYQQGDTAQPWTVFTLLGERLIPPAVRRRLHPDHRLLIVAGGELHHVPWAALRLGSRWLAELATVQLAPGLQLWSWLAARPCDGAQALVLGLRQAAAPSRPLQQALASLGLVESLWPAPVTCWEDNAATRRGLLEWAEQGRLARLGLLHIACHGQLVADHGLFAHLKLADGDLFYEDVLRLGLEGALVVLAACEGASSEVLQGEEVLSLSRAFLGAGARDVVASMWQLYDETVMELLRPFYQALAEGADAPSALAQAQRRLIARAEQPEPAGRVLALPMVWASLCVIGAGVRDGHV